MEANFAESAESAEFAEFAESAESAESAEFAESADIISDILFHPLQGTLVWEIYSKNHTKFLQQKQKALYFRSSLL